MALITHKYFTVDISYSKVHNKYIGKIRELKGDVAVITGATFEEAQKIFIDKVDEWIPDDRRLH